MSMREISALESIEIPDLKIEERTVLNLIQYRVVGDRGHWWWSEDGAISSFARRVEATKRALKEASETLETSRSIIDP